MEHFLMQKKLSDQIQSLLVELTKESYLVRQKEIAKLLEPYNDSVIPIFIKRLKYRGEKYHTEYNAIKILALSADPRGIMPLLRHMEKNSGWANDIFNLLREALREKNEEARREVNDQFIRYLEEGPRIPAPEPFNPVASEKSFNDFIGALMKSTGVTELDDEAQELVDEAKQKWLRPPDTTEFEKNKTREIQEIIGKVVDTLTEFDGLRDSRLKTILSRYVKEYGFNSIAGQHALTALSIMEPSLAAMHLNELAASSSSRPDTTIKRIVGRKVDSEITFYEFTICAREPDAERWKERTYNFIYEDGLVFFLTRGIAVKKWLAGQASNKDSAMQLAIEYVGRWIQDIDSIINTPDRYAECIHVVQQFIDFEKWGFEQTHISQVYELPWERPLIIYNSALCRVKVAFRSYGEMYDQSDVLSIQYGRLHAADKEHTIIWRGEPHHCWHDVSLALCFLDNMSPEEAAKVLWNHPIMEEYKRSKPGSQPAIEAGMHSAIWEQYGRRLFQLFDLRSSDLWDEYSRFIKRVYEIRGFKHYGSGVPREKIC
jgi:hypothetical protein